MLADSDEISAEAGCSAVYHCSRVEGSQQRSTAAGQLRRGVVRGHEQQRGLLGHAQCLHLSISALSSQQQIVKAKAAAQGATAAEWREASSAALLLGSRGEALAEAMSNSAACLVMDFIPGKPLLSLGAPFDPRRLHRTAADLGRWTPVLLATSAGHAYVET